MIEGPERNARERRSKGWKENWRRGGGPTGPPSRPTSLGPISQSSQGGVRFGLERLTHFNTRRGKKFQP
jgi:hypothetical protein